MNPYQYAYINILFKTGSDFRGLHQGCWWGIGIPHPPHPPHPHHVRREGACGVSPQGNVVRHAFGDFSKVSVVFHVVRAAHEVGAYTHVGFVHAGVQGAKGGVLVLPLGQPLYALARDASNCASHIGVFRVLLGPLVALLDVQRVALCVGAMNGSLVHVHVLQPLNHQSTHSFDVSILSRVFKVFQTILQVVDKIHHVHCVFAAVV